jgi:hypothetical protein
MTEGRTQVSQDEDQRETSFAEAAKAHEATPETPVEAVFRLDDVHVYYNKFLALRGSTSRSAGTRSPPSSGPQGAARAP